MSAVTRINALLTQIRRKSTKKLAIGILCIFCIARNLILEDDYDEVDFWGIDSIKSGRSLSIEDPTHHPYEYETLVPPSQIDFSIDERLTWEGDANCNDVLLYMPYQHSINGQGAQLNAYIKVSLLATFLNKALVVLEADTFHYLPEWGDKLPSDTLYDGGSQFGCPVDAFNNENEIDADFPMGLSRLIQHPRWVGRGCPVPTCGGSMNYDDWEARRKVQKGFMLKTKRFDEFECVEGDRTVKITPVGSGAMIQAFRPNIQIVQRMLDHTSAAGRNSAIQWATRLGASKEEAEAFSKITSPTQIWDFLGALVNRSGLIRFQPWVARDVQEHIQSMNLPLDKPYDAFHIRRGDKLIQEAQKEVNNYWRSKGIFGKQMANYIPFSHYVEKAWGACKATRQSKRRNLKNPAVKTTYIATDDPSTVHEEISSIPRVNGKGASLIDECNHKVNFVFAPTTKDTIFHVNDRRAGDNCQQVYKRNIAAIADLVILARADKFVGDYNSNWGRFIKVARSFLEEDGAKPLVVTKPMVVAFGPSHPGEPGRGPIS
jgi:hypothetical protein